MVSTWHASIAGILLFYAVRWCIGGCSIFAAQEGHAHCAPSVLLSGTSGSFMSKKSFFVGDEDFET